MGVLFWLCICLIIFIIVGGICANCKMGDQRSEILEPHYTSK